MSQLQPSSVAKVFWSFLPSIALLISQGLPKTSYACWHSITDANEGFFATLLIPLQQWKKQKETNRSRAKQSKCYNFSYLSNFSSGKVQWCLLLGQGSFVPRDKLISIKNTADTEEPSAKARNVEKSSRCLKITEKVSFNIASEASYVYILSGQKFIKNAQNGQFWRVFENLKLAVKQCYQTGQF